MLLFLQGKLLLMSVSPNLVIYVINSVLFYSVPQYLERFVHRGPNGYSAYCSERLRRIISNGERKELPCLIEIQVETLNHVFVLLLRGLFCLQLPDYWIVAFTSIQSHLPSPYWQAAKSQEPIDASVTLTDERSVSLHLDSASTSAEVCQAVADKIGLRDTYGFSLYISLFEKVSFASLSLGSSYPCRPSLPVFAYKCAHTLVVSYTVNPVSECCLISSKFQHQTL